MDVSFPKRQLTTHWIPEWQRQFLHIFILYKGRPLRVEVRFEPLVLNLLVALGDSARL